MRTRADAEFPPLAGFGVDRWREWRCSAWSSKRRHLAGWLRRLPVLERAAHWRAVPRHDDAPHSWRLGAELAQYEAAMLLLPLAALGVIPLLAYAGLYVWRVAPRRPGFPYRLSDAASRAAQRGELAVFMLLAFLLLMRRRWSTSVASASLIVFTLLTASAGGGLADVARS